MASCFYTVCFIVINDVGLTMTAIKCKAFMKTKRLASVLSPDGHGMPRILLLLCIILISGCATLNEEECQLADWKAIGYEDGSNGASVDRIGRHRSACAKHGVTPNLEAYKEGREQGLRIFCQPGNGFRLGRRGSSYGGICHPDLEPEFIHAYKIGKEIYLAQAVVQKMRHELTDKQHALQHLGDSLAAKEAQLIGKQGNYTDRAQLLLEIKEINHEQGELEAEIIHLEKNIAVAERELAIITTRSGY